MQKLNGRPVKRLYRAGIFPKSYCVDLLWMIILIGVGCFLKAANVNVSSYSM